MFKRNILLSLHYVPSKENPANSPSRALSDLDCSLRKNAWKCVETAFGPHSIDLMALLENEQHDCSGWPLWFFSRFPCFQALKTNVFFSQHIQVNKNAYIFLPFVLIGPLIKHLSSVGCPYTIVVPVVTPGKYWWTLLQQFASVSFMLGSHGCTNTLLYPAKSGVEAWEPRSPQWDLWVFRVLP